MKNETFIFNRPLIIGHRGFPAKYPENTMVSFLAAIRAGAGMIELDITLSRDSEVVVIHDDTLDRTTNGSGQVSSFTLQELRRLDAGGWFHKKFVNEKMPTLDEVLDALLDKTMLNIEIKPNITDNGSYIGLIVEKTLAAIKTRKTDQPVLISSFDPEILKAVVGRQQHPAVALLLEEAIGEKDLTLAENLGAVSIHPDMDTLDIETANRVHARNFFLFPYNAESEKSIRRSFKMGVEGIFVDDPVMAIMCYQNLPDEIPW